MNEAPRDPGGFASRGPYPAEVLDDLPVPMKDKWDDVSGGALNGVGVLALPLEDISQGGEDGERERPPVVVLRRARLQPDHPGDEVNQGPGEAKNFTPAPPCQIGKLDGRAHLRGQGVKDDPQMPLLEEPGAGVANLQARDVGTAGQEPGADSEGKRPLQHGAFIMDRGGRGAVVEARRLVRCDAVAGDIDRAAAHPESAGEAGDCLVGALERNSSRFPVWWVTRRAGHRCAARGGATMESAVRR